MNHLVLLFHLCTKSFGVQRYPFWIFASLLSMFFLSGLYFLMQLPYPYVVPYLSLKCHYTFPFYNYFCIAYDVFFHLWVLVCGSEQLYMHQMWSLLTSSSISLSSRYIFSSFFLLVYMFLLQGFFFYNWLGLKLHISLLFIEEFNFFNSVCISISNTYSFPCSSISILTVLSHPLTSPCMCSCISYFLLTTVLHYFIFTFKAHVLFLESHYCFSFLPLI